MSDEVDRAERALKGLSISEAMARVRAIIGPSNMPADEQGQLAQQALEALRNLERPTPKQLSALELVIRLMRPAPLFKGGVLQAVDDEVKPDFQYWEQFRGAVSRYAYSIGRIDLLPDESVGTGFLVSDRLLVTNKHVLDQLSRGSDVLEEGQAIVRFGYEFGTVETGNRDVPIMGVEAVHSTLDIALLTVVTQTLDGNRAALELDDEPPVVGEPVAVIGYPFKDSRNPLFVRGIYGDKFGVKRGALGEIVKLGPQAIFHDCSTLGGNSGSPVLALKTARVVGLHCEGFFLYRNEAVDGGSLRAFVQQNA